MDWKLFWAITILVLCGITRSVYLSYDESHQEPINSIPVTTHSELEVVSPIMEVQCLRPNGEVRDYLVKQVVGDTRYRNNLDIHPEKVSVTFTTMEGIRYTVAINRCEFRWL